MLYVDGVKEGTHTLTLKWESDADNCAWDIWPEFLDGHEDAGWYDRLYKKGGHIVVKAYDKGKYYKVYILDSTNEDMIVKDVYGPYSAQ